MVFIRPVVIRNTDEAFVDAQQRLSETKDPEEIQNFMENVEADETDDEPEEDQEMAPDEAEDPNELKEMPTRNFHKG